MEDDSKAIEDENSQDSIQNDPDNNALYECPEPGCIMRYKKEGSLIRHLILGKHKLEPERKTLQDYVIDVFGEKVSNIEQSIFLQDIKTAAQAVHRENEQVTNLNMGWGIKMRKSRTNLNANQKDYLDALFEAGKRGPKHNAETVAKNMKTAEVNGQS